jgi:hypothetical protein
MNKASAKSAPRPGSVGPSNDQKWPDWPNTDATARACAGAVTTRGPSVAARRLAHRSVFAVSTTTARRRHRAMRMRWGLIEMARHR